MMTDRQKNCQRLSWIEFVIKGDRFATETPLCLAEIPLLYIYTYADIRL